MSLHHRVVWSQGMFLQPHHFQQESRYFERLVDARVRATQGHAWGFDVLVLDEAQLALGSVALQRASGVMPDGTPFSIPDGDALPPPLVIGAEVQDEIVVLAVPLARTGVSEIDFGDGDDPTMAQSMARYDASDVNLRDQANAADDPEPVQLGAPRLRLMRQRDAGDAFAVLSVVRVLERRADQQVVLDRAHIAPQSRIDATAQLSAAAVLMHELVQKRAHALASQMGQLGQGVSEVADFLMLLVLNRSEPLLRQMAGAPSVHPWALHQVLLQLAGELATFAATTRRPPDYPLYRHDDLKSVFTPLLQELRDMLSAVLHRHAQQIELKDRGHGVSSAVVADSELLQTAGFVLAVRAQVPAEQLRQLFPNRSKLGPAERIRELVNGNLPGIGLRSLPVAPRQLPYHAGSHYFELDRQGDLYRQFQRSGAVALHVAGDFPQLELEFWAVRQS
jgi:type VI secretion system protein ImpJ